MSSSIFELTHAPGVRVEPDAAVAAENTSQVESPVWTPWAPAPAQAGQREEHTLDGTGSLRTKPVVIWP